MVISLVIRDIANHIFHCTSNFSRVSGGIFCRRSTRLVYLCPVKL